MNGTTLFGEKTKDLLGELGCRGSETEERMDVGSLLQSWSRGRTQAEVERETKRAPNGRDAANDVSPIDGATVPSVSGSVGGFHKNGIGATIVGSNGNGLVEEAVEMLDAIGLMIAASGDMRDLADFFEQAFEGAAVIDDDQTTKTDFKRTPWTRRRARL